MMALNWNTYGLKTEEGQNELLKDLGHFESGDRSKAIASYQNYSGLKQTGIWTQEETDRLHERVCGCPDISHARTAKGHWEFAEGEKHTIQLWRNVRGANDQFVKDWLAGANWWSSSESGIDLEFELVDESRDCRIWATYQRIDGRNRTLAWSYLPEQHQRYRSRFLEQRYDPDDMNSQSRVRRVSAHEIGHAIGLDHIPASLGTALMNPFDNGSITKVLPLDIAEAVERYGKSQEPTDPPPEETPCKKTVNLFKIAQKKKQECDREYQEALDQIAKI